MTRQLLAAAGVLALLLGAPATGALTGGAAVDDTPAQSVPGEPSETYARGLTVDLQYGSTTASVKVSLAYAARSEREAAAAQNGTLDVPWFGGRQRVERLFNRTADSDDSLSEGSTWVGHTDRLARSDVGDDPSPEHGWVLVEYSVAWYGFAAVGEDVVVGRHYAAVFHDDWDLTLVVPNTWEPTTLDDDAEVISSERSGTEYYWEMIDNDSHPLVAFDAPVRPTETDAEAPLGVSGGVVLAVVSISAVLYHRRRRRGG